MTEQDMLKMTIEQLSKRVDALEGSWRATLGALGFSAVSLAVSIVAVTHGKKQVKAACLQGVKSNVDAAKSQLESLTMAIAPLRAVKRPTADQKAELGIKQQVLEAVLERLLNAFNDGCDKFFKDQVRRRDFADLYHHDIGVFIKAYPEKFAEPITQFDSMLRYYRERIKKPT